MRKLILTLTCCLILQLGMNAQTQLRPGELILLEVNENNNFIFMPLVDLEAGTAIYFTDQGVDNVEGFSRTDDNYETVIRYITPLGGIEAGTIIRFSQPGGDFSQWGGDIIPLDQIREGISISSFGDQLTVFQDSDPTNNIKADAEPRFLFAVNLSSSDKNSPCSATNDNETKKPFGLFPVTYAVGDGAGTFLAMGDGARCADEIEYAIYDAATYGLSFPTTQIAYEVMSDPDHWIRVTIGTEETLTRAYINALDALLAQDMATLPVIMTAYVAKERDGNVELTWRTAQEIDSDYFAVEHSTNGVDYTELSRVQAAGSSTEPRKYVFVHESPATGENYYRLRQVDLDASFIYSDTRIVTIDRNIVPVNIFPNPAFNVVSVRGLDTRGSVRVRILDNSGAIMTERVTFGDNNIEAFEVNHLAKGLYFIQIISDNEVTTHKFVKF